MSKFLSVKDDSITSIADSIRKKTGKTNKLTFPGEFVSEIDGIQTGGGGSTPAADLLPKDVNFFDYDGTIIASYTEDEARVLTELPTPPEHNGLVFQGWNYTLQEVIDNADAADVGAMYTTDDGATRIKIVIASENALDFALRYYQTGSGSVISWGDGETDTQTVSSVRASHTYKKPGPYIIKIMPNEDCTLRFSVSGGMVYDISSEKSYISKSAVIETNIGNRVTEITSAFKNCLLIKSVSMPNSVNTIGSAAFNNSGIGYVTIPACITSISDDAFRNCQAMQHISFPVNVQDIASWSFANCNSIERINIQHVSNPGDYLFSDSHSLKNVVFNSEATYIGTSICKGCSSLSDVKFLGSVKRIYSYAFTYCYSLRQVDLTNCDSVPILSDVNVFMDSPSDCEILVPASLAEEWKTATNWTTYASRIKGV